MKCNKCGSDTHLQRECDGSGPGPPMGAGKGKGSFHAQQQPANEYESQMAAYPQSQWPSMNPTDQPPQQVTTSPTNDNPGFFSFVGDPMEQVEEQVPQCGMCEDEPMGELQYHDGPMGHLLAAMSEQASREQASLHSYTHSFMVGTSASSSSGQG